MMLRPITLRLSQRWGALRGLEHFVVRGGAAILVCGACSSPPPEVPEPEPCALKTVKTSVITSERVNLSETREPRPVQIRLYQLKNDTRFLNADFEQIWRTDADVLSDDLLKVDEVPVYPNSRTQISVEREEEARFLVAAGLFRNPKGKSWFASFEFPEPSLTFCGGESGETALPEFYVWVEDTRIEDGVAHADEFPDGRTVSVEPTKAAGSDTAGDGSSSSDATSGVGSPQIPNARVPNARVPNAPQVNGPATPKAPQVNGPATPTVAQPAAPTTPSAPQVGGGIATELQ